MGHLQHCSTSYAQSTHLSCGLVDCIFVVTVVVEVTGEVSCIRRCAASALTLPCVTASPILSVSPVVESVIYKLLLVDCSQIQILQLL